MNELRRNHDEGQATLFCSAWIYSLDTMIQQGSTKKTCTWHVEGAEANDDSGGGDITLRRVGWTCHPLVLVCFERIVSQVVNPTRTQEPKRNRAPSGLAEANAWRAVP